MKLLFFILSFFLFTSLHAQDSIFNYLTADVTNEETVLIRWEIKGGNSCNGIYIERSIDDSTWTEIHFIPGICGNESTPVPYQYEDTDPVSNQFNYYRVVPGFGFPTQSVSVFFVKLNTDGYFVYPNPTENQVKIYFKNTNNENCTVYLANLKGQTVLKEQVNGNLWEPNLSNFPAGIYFFSIDHPNNLISGKLIKN